jgi:hypothetical protein
MKQATLIIVPATVHGQTLSVTYRVTVAVNAGGNTAKCDNPVSVWGYVTAVPVRVTSEPELDVVITPAGDGGREP